MINPFIITEKQRKDFKSELLSALLENDSYYMYEYDLTFVSSKLYANEINLRTKRKISNHILRDVAEKYNLKVVGYDVQRDKVRLYKYMLRSVK